MERHHQMPSGLFPRKADIADNYDKPSSLDKDAETFGPDFVEFRKKCVVVLNVSQLSVRLVVFFQAPVGRGGDDEVDGFIIDTRKIACISEHQFVLGWNKPGDCFDLFDEVCIF